MRFLAVPDSGQLQNYRTIKPSGLCLQIAPGNPGTKRKLRIQGKNSGASAPFDKSCRTPGVADPKAETRDLTITYSLCIKITYRLLCIGCRPFIFANALSKIVAKAALRSLYGHVMSYAERTTGKPKCGPASDKRGST